MLKKNNHVLYRFQKIQLLYHVAEAMYDKYVDLLEYENHIRTSIWYLIRLRHVYEHLFMNICVAEYFYYACIITSLQMNALTHMNICVYKYTYIHICKKYVKVKVSLIILMYQTNRFHI